MLLGKKRYTWTVLLRFVFIDKEDSSEVFWYCPILVKFYGKSRSSCPKVFCKKGAPENFANHRFFPVNFAKFPKTPFLIERGFFCELSKNFRNVFLMHCLNFLKVHKNTSEKMFAKYLRRCLFRKNNNAINCDDNDDAISFLILGPLLLKYQIHLRSSTAFLSRLKFWFAKNLVNLGIAPPDTSFYLSRPCKNSRFQKVVQLFNLMRIMLLA